MLLIARPSAVLPRRQGMESLPACRRGVTATTSVVRCSSSGENSGPSPTAKPARRRPPPPGLMQQQDPNIDVVKVEELEGQAFEGVVQVDREGDDDGTGPGKLAMLIAGDFTALLTFATIGHFSHTDNLDVAEIFMAALPFWIGWFGIASLVGCYSDDVQKGAEGTGTALKGWAGGIPAGVAVRCLMKGYVPEKSFFIVAMVVNFVLLVGWRSAFASRMASVNNIQKKGNKSGSIFELFSLIGSLTRRW